MALKLASISRRQQRHLITDGISITRQPAGMAAMAGAAAHDAQPAYGGMYHRLAYALCMKNENGVSESYGIGHLVA